MLTGGAFFAQAYRIDGPAFLQILPHFQEPGWSEWGVSHPNKSKWWTEVEFAKASNDAFREIR